MGGPAGPGVTPWTSSVLSTAHSTDVSLRARHGQKVEVLGTTKQGAGTGLMLYADVIVLADGVPLYVPIAMLRRVRTEHR